MSNSNRQEYEKRLTEDREKRLAQARNNAELVQ
jgi:hypothetical protein